MSQAEVLAALEASAKASAKTALSDLNKDGGVVSLEVDALAAGLPTYGPALASLLKPFIKQILDSAIAKI